MKKRAKASGFQGVSFGTMDGIITSLGIMIGLYAAVQTSEIILIGILGAGIANSFANAAGFYVSEESENIHTKKEILRAAFTSFMSTFVSVAVTSIPFFIFDTSTAILWGMLIVLAFLFYIAHSVAKIVKKNALLIFAKYFVLVLIVSAVSFVVGSLL